MDNDMGQKDGTVYDYGFRVYDGRIAKFLSVDPLTKDYPMLTAYQFASDNPISGIDQDGLEYVYYLRSPSLSRKFIHAYVSMDLNEQRRILNYATHNAFTPESAKDVDGKIFMGGYDDGDAVGELVYDETAPEGFTLIPFEWKKEGDIAPMEESSWPTYARNKDVTGPFDKNFPTDVRPESFYEGNDFVGKYHDSEFIVGNKGSGSGTIVGHMKGWGYYQFSTKVTGVVGNINLDITMYAHGMITGKATMAKYLNPGSFTGEGRDYAKDAGIASQGTWIGLAGNTKTWEGEYSGLSIGLSTNTSASSYN